MDQLGYIKETWGLSGERANEIIRFADNKIRTNENWVKKVRENSEQKNRDFDTADQIRLELSDMDIEIEDTPDGTIWKSKK